LFPNKVFSPSDNALTQSQAIRITDNTLCKYDKITRSRDVVALSHFNSQSTVNMEKQYRVGVLSRLKVVEAEPKLTQHRVA